MEVSFPFQDNAQALERASGFEFWYDGSELEGGALTVPPGWRVNLTNIDIEFPKVKVDQPHEVQDHEQEQDQEAKDTKATSTLGAAVEELGRARRAIEQAHAERVNGVARARAAVAQAFVSEEGVSDNTLPAERLNALRKAIDDSAQA